MIQIVVLGHLQNLLFLYIGKDINLVDTFLKGGGKMDK